MTKDLFLGSPGLLDRVKNAGQAQLFFYPLCILRLITLTSQILGQAVGFFLPPFFRRKFSQHFPAVGEEALQRAEDWVIDAALVPMRHDWREFETPSGKWKVHSFDVGQSSPDTTPLVLVHGAFTGALTWYPVLRQLAQDFSWIILLDIPGNGRSIAPSAMATSSDRQQIVDLFVEGLEGWRRARGLPRFHLVGHSYGGFVSGLFAERHPEALTRLTLVAPGGQLPTAGPGSWMFAMMFSVTPQAFFRALGPIGFDLFRRTLWKRLRLHMPDPLVHYYYQLIAAPSGCMDITISRFMAFPSVNECYWTYPSIGKTQAVAVPVDFVWGEDDPVLDSRLGFLLHKLTEGTRLYIIEGAGHNPAHSAPHKFAATLKRISTSQGLAVRRNGFTAGMGATSPVSRMLETLFKSGLVDHRQRVECLRRREKAEALFSEVARANEETSEIIRV